MDTTARGAEFLDADAFLRTDQHSFGPAWRYELVRGAIVAHAVPSPEHGALLANLAADLHRQLRAHPNCRAEIGSGAVPRRKYRDTACVPDAMIRCEALPRVLFEVISPSDLQHKRQWDQKRADLQAVDGVQEIVEIFQDEMLVHVYRRQGDGWMFDWIAGADAAVTLASVDVSLPLAALYAGAAPEA